MRKALILMMVASLVGVVACTGDVGDSCDDEGESGNECDEGLVCGKKKETGGSLVCLKQCFSPTDCGAGEECTGVGKTSLKACRAR